MNMSRLLLGWMVLLASATTFADPVIEGTTVMTQAIGVDGQLKNAPITALDSFTSTPGETKVAFLKRVGLAMEQYSLHHQVETCATLWEDPQDTHWALQVFTANAHTTCLFNETNPTTDTSLVKDAATIHSHPLITRYKANAVDAALTGATEGHTYELVNAFFSPADKEAGPGYLVTRHLQYQRDNGQVLNDLGALND